MQSYLWEVSPQVRLSANYLSLKTELVEGEVFVNFPKETWTHSRSPTSPPHTRSVFPYRSCKFSSHSSILLLKCQPLEGKAMVYSPLYAQCLHRAEPLDTEFFLQ